MQVLHRYVGEDFEVRVGHTDRADGDLSLRTVDRDELIARRRAILDRPWAAVHQVHGDRVIDISAERAGRVVRDQPIAVAWGDALVTEASTVALAVHSGDCPTVALIHPHGGLAVAHGGWRGLEAGVFESAARRLRRRCGPGQLHAVLGAHIRPACYSFGPDDLTRLQRRFGLGVAGLDRHGGPALDLAAAIDHELERLGAQVLARVDECTGDNADRYWSHRIRQESGRQALIAWIDRPPTSPEAQQ